MKASTHGRHGGAGFYYDYGSFEEVFLGARPTGRRSGHAGRAVELPRQVGRQRCSASLIDGYNNSFQGSNLSEPTRGRPRRAGLRLPPGSNEVLRYYDVNFNVGGPIKKDKVWWIRRFASVSTSPP